MDRQRAERGCGDSEIARSGQGGSDENRSIARSARCAGCSLAGDRRVFGVSGSRRQNDPGRQQTPWRVVGWHPRLGHELRDGTVSEIDASTGTVVKTIPVGSGPYGVSSDGTHVWVTNLTTDDTVSEIDASTGTVVNTIPVGSDPWGVVGWHPRLGHERRRRYGQ